jgi:Putative prokaryotic signal transducing protein
VVQDTLDRPPPPTRLRRGGGGSGWIELTRAANDIDAHLLVGRLTEAGIESTTMKDRSAPGAWLYGGSNPWAPVVIMVRRLQLEDARIVMAEIAFELPAREPHGEVKEAHPWRRLLVWWAAALALGALLTGISLMRTAEAFQRCGLAVCISPSDQ